MSTARTFMVACMLILLTASGHAALVTLQNPTATFSQNGFEISAAIDGTATSGWAINPSITSQTAVFETSTNLFTAGGTLAFTLDQLFPQPSQHTIGRFRLSATTD